VPRSSKIKSGAVRISSKRSSEGSAEPGQRPAQIIQEVGDRNEDHRQAAFDAGIGDGCRQMGFAATVPSAQQQPPLGSMRTPRSIVGPVHVPLPVGAARASGRKAAR
jgi:hypothetical protein